MQMVGGNQVVQNTVQIQVFKSCRSEWAYSFCSSKIANSEKRIRIGIVMIMRHKRLKVIERDKQKSDTVLTTQSVGTLQKEAMNPARPDAKAIVMEQSEGTVEQHPVTVEETSLLISFRIIVALDLSKGTNPLQAKGSRSIHKMAEQDSPPPTITAMKIPIIKKGEYDIWSMRMRQYICHTDHNLWDIIIYGDLQEEAAPAGEQSSPPAPKTAK
ncbi:hypothetical protein Tco_1320242 [Tanacetum coccineum]